MCSYYFADELLHEDNHDFLRKLILGCGDSVSVSASQCILGIPRLSGLLARSCCTEAQYNLATEGNLTKDIALDQRQKNLFGRLQIACNAIRIALGFTPFKLFQLSPRLISVLDSDYCDMKMMFYQNSTAKGVVPASPAGHDHRISSDSRETFLPVEAFSRCKKGKGTASKPKMRSNQVPNAINCDDDINSQLDLTVSKSKHKNTKAIKMTKRNNEETFEAAEGISSSDALATERDLEVPHHAHMSIHLKSDKADFADLRAAVLNVTTCNNETENNDDRTEWKVVGKKSDKTVALKKSATFSGSKGQLRIGNLAYSKAIAVSVSNEEDLVSENGSGTSRLPNATSRDKNVKDVCIDEYKTLPSTFSGNTRDSKLSDEFNSFRNIINKYIMNFRMINLVWQGTGEREAGNYEDLQLLNQFVDGIVSEICLEHQRRMKELNTINENLFNDLRESHHQALQAVNLRLFIANSALEHEREMRAKEKCSVDPQSS